MTMKLGSLVSLGAVLMGCSAAGEGELGAQSSALSPGLYVALGDSYSAGVGSRSYYDAGCQRSEYAYPFEVAATGGYSLVHVACSGARVPDVIANQLSAITTNTALVTMSIGGNDAGFSSVITECAKPWPTTCWGKIDAARSFITNSLPGLLNDVYNRIRTRAPSARVVIVGYPRLFNGEQCNFLARISPGEQEELNDTADLLSDTISRTAAAHGFAYVDPRAAFTGHAICDDVEWVNGLSNPISESYHPNVRGYDAYADLVLGKL
jgi:lysophospholipase L1-like esterase